MEASIQAIARMKSDFPTKFGIPRQSGLVDALHILKGIDGIAQVYLTEKDVVRHELGQSMIIRYAPEILFEEDHNIEYGIHIASVLKQVRSEEETNDESSDGQE